METITFLKQLAGCSVAALAAALALNQIPVLSDYRNFSLMSVGGFVLFSLLLFLLSKKSSQSKNDHLFVRLFLVATVVKMFLALGFVWLYFRLTAPASHLFVLPFFAVYCFYTVFEIHFLGKLAKSS